MAKMNENPLSKFFQKPEDLEKETLERLARLMEPFVKHIDSTNGAIRFNPAFNDKLNSKQKVLVFLLARLALATHNPEFSAGLLPKEIEVEADLPGGTVRPKLTELMDDRIIARDSDGKYLVKSIERAEEVLEDVISKSQ